MTKYAINNIVISLIIFKMVNQINNPPKT